MNRNDVFAGVAKIINNTLNEKRSIELQHTLVEDLGMDSIGVVELVVELDEKYGVEIDDDEIEDYKTVEQIVGCVMASITV